MATHKPSTKAGFHPSVAITAELRQPALEAIRIDGRLDEVRERKALQRMHMVMLRTVRLGNIVSSHQIEGLPVTVQSAAQAIDQTGEDTPLSQDLRNFAKAYEKYHLDDPPKLTVETIRKLHGILFTPESLDEGEPGKFKDKPNGVKDKATGQVVFTATPPEDTEAELDALCKWFYGEAQALWPPLAAGLFFVEFEAIHPFLDGNGRLGRLLNLIALKQAGLKNAFLVPIDTRFRQRRDNYYEALEATNLGTNYHVWLRFYARELRRAYREANERSTFRAVLDLPTKPSSRDMLEWVLSRPDTSWFARGDYPNENQLSGTALFHALTELTELGILEPQGERRGRKYRLNQNKLQEIIVELNEEED